MKKTTFWATALVGFLIVQIQTQMPSKRTTGINDMVTLAGTLADKPEKDKLKYKMLRKADGTFDFEDSVQDCSEFIYYLMSQKNNDLFNKLADGNSGNVTILKNNIEGMGGTFSDIPVAASLAIWWDETSKQGKHVELVINVELKPFTPPQVQDYKITSIGARGKEGTRVPAKLLTQSLQSFKKINSTATLIGFWNFN